MNSNQITIDCQNQKLIVDKNTSNKKIFFRIVPVKKDKKSGVRTIGTSEWEIYDTKTEDMEDVVIDLSSLNRAKESFIQIMGDQARKPITICIPAVNSDLKAVFVCDEKCSVDIKTKKGQTLDDRIGALKYRTKYSG